MSFDTCIRVEDPLDAYELFTAARSAAARGKNVKWALTDCGDGIHLLQTNETASTVNVQFPAAGGQIPDWDEDGRPDGYALGVLYPPRSPATELGDAGPAPAACQEGRGVARRPGRPVGRGGRTRMRCGSLRVPGDRNAC